ncbi:MAG: O-antigen ligase family protein [Dehalococcoidales bacterium]|nr:O-antigen ligase family protein [Dehalococcoidales bacterium]
MGSKLISFLEVIQPFFAAPVFLSVIAMSPPMLVAWLIALAPWILYIGFARRFVRRTPLDIPIIMYCVGLLIGFMVSPNRAISSEALLTTFASILIYYGLVNNADRGRTYWLAMSGVCGVIILGLVIWFFSQGDPRLLYFNERLFKLAAILPKTGGPVLQFNSIGIFLAVVIPLIISVALFSKGTTRWITLTSGIFLSVILFLSASGGGWGAAVCGIIFVLAAWRLLTLWVTVPATGIVIAVIAANYHKFSWPSLIFSTESLSSRIDIWVKTLDLMKKSWFTGLGLGTWSEVFKGWIHAHSSYIQLWADTGLVGVLAFIVAAVMFLRIAWCIVKAPKQSNWYGIGVGLIGGMLAGAAASVFDVITYGAFRAPEYHYLSIPLLWIMAALFVISYRRLREPATVKIATKG